MRSTFKVLFYLKRNEEKKNGQVPVMCRITIDGTISQFSCKATIDPSLWDISAGRASGRSNEAVAINRKLDAIRVGINKHYTDIFEREGYIGKHVEIDPPKTDETDPLKTDEIDPLKTVEIDPLKTEQIDPPRVVS